MGGGVGYSEDKGRGGGVGYSEDKDVFRLNRKGRISQPGRIFLDILGDVLILKDTIGNVEM
jgi:hypothetical protein